MAERLCNCLIGLIVGRVLRDKHKRWRLDRDNNRKLEAQSRNGARPTPTTAHAAAVHRRSPRGSIDSPTDPKPQFDRCGMTMPPGLGFALAPLSASPASSDSESAMESTSPPAVVNPVRVQSIAEGPSLLSTSALGRASEEVSLPGPSPVLASPPTTSRISGPPRNPALGAPAAAPAKPSSPPIVKQQIIMPDRHYRNVHSHYAKVPAHVEKVPAHVEHNETNDRIKITDVMQSYEYSIMDIDHHIGFNLHGSQGKAHKPARKSIDLEELPPLSSAVARQITHRERILAQDAVLARVRKEQENDAERQRRAKRAQQHQAPPFKMRTGPLYSRNSSEPDALTLSATPANSPVDTGQTNISPADRKQPDKGVQENHVRGAPNLIQQQQKPSTIVKRRHRSVPVAERRPLKAKSTLRKVMTGSMVNSRS